ncbi:hypothetical protein [Phytopseudomonas flavescens]|nr:hypothetical protein [Pseudomonas flavescens]
MNPVDGPLNELMHSFMAINRHAPAAMKSPAWWPGWRVPKPGW